MTRIVSIAACIAVLASAAPAFAQTMPPIQPIQTTTGIGLKMLPGMNNGQVNRAIPGTPGSVGSVVNPVSDLQQGRRAAPAPLFRDGLAALNKPSVNAANRQNGVVGQLGVAPVRQVSAVNPVGSPPANQRSGATRPVMVWGN